MKRGCSCFFKMSVELDKDFELCTAHRMVLDQVIAVLAFYLLIVY